MSMLSGRLCSVTMDVKASCDRVVSLLQQLVDIGTSEYSLLILFDVLTTSCPCCAVMSVIKLDDWELEAQQQMDVSGQNM